jgi:hypothetical protein
MDMAADIQVMVGELGAMPLIMPGEAVLAAIKAEVETHRNHGILVTYLGRMAAHITLPHMALEQGAG